MDLNSILQLYGKFGPFFLCTVMLKDTWFRNEPAMNHPHVFPQFMFRFVPTVALAAGDSSGFWLCHERIPPWMFAGLRIDKRCDFSQDTPDSMQMESIIQAVDKCYDRAKPQRVHYPSGVAR